MSLLSLLGCTPTTRDLPARLGDLRVKIEAEHLTTIRGGRSTSYHSLRAVLSDAKGADVERADVKVEVNGTPMRFGVGRGNYYDRHPSYRLGDEDRWALTAGTEYRFVLVLPDNARHDIGTLRAPGALAPGQFDFASKPPASGPVTIAWRDLVEPAELRLGRADQRREADGSRVIQSAGPYDPEALRRTIGPGWFRAASGRWVVPDAFLVSTADRKLLSLHAEIVATREGRVSATLSRHSSMRATRRLEMEMEFATLD